MHVLFLPKWYPGRNDPQLGEFIRKHALAAAHHDRVSVLFVHPRMGMDQPVEMDVDDGENLWELRAYYRPSTFPWLPVRKLLNLVKYLRTVQAAMVQVTKERGKPDLHHVHIMVRPVLMALWAKARQGIPFIISEQSSEYIDGTWQRKGALFRRFNLHAFRRAAATTAVSPWLQRAMCSANIPGEWQVIPNVLPLEKTKVAQRGPSDHLLMVADLVDHTKNISGVFRALRICKEQGTILRLELIGGGPDEIRLKGLVNDLDIVDQVHFHGQLANVDVMHIMAGAGSVVINSRVETFSVVTGEALALGKPVIATRCGGPQALVNQNNGVLIEVNDDRALAEAMLRIQRDHDRFDPVKIRTSVADRFSSQAIGRQFHELYRSVLHG